MTIAASPGSFDPVTLGHVNIAMRACVLTDEMIFVVGFNASKWHAFDSAQRLVIAETAVEGLDGVCATTLSSPLVDLCEEFGAGAVVKGLREETDFSTEEPMALMNRSLTGIETVLVLNDPALTHIASPPVRDVVWHGGNTTDLVSPDTAETFTSIRHTEEQQ